MKIFSIILFGQLGWSLYSFSNGTWTMRMLWLYYCATLSKTVRCCSLQGFFRVQELCTWCTTPAPFMLLDPFHILVSGEGFELGASIKKVILCVTICAKGLTLLFFWGSWWDRWCSADNMFIIFTDACTLFLLNQNGKSTNSNIFSSGMLQQKSVHPNIIKSWWCNSHKCSHALWVGGASISLVNHSSMSQSQASVSPCM